MSSLGFPHNLLSSWLLLCWIEGTIVVRFFHFLREIKNMDTLVNVQGWLPWNMSEPCLSQPAQPRRQGVGGDQTLTSGLQSIASVGGNLSESKERAWWEIFSGAPVWRSDSGSGDDLWVLRRSPRSGSVQGLGFSLSLSSHTPLPLKKKRKKEIVPCF